MRRKRRNLPDRVIKDIEGRRQHPSGLSKRARYAIAAGIVVVMAAIIAALILLAIHAHTGA